MLAEGPAATRALPGPRPRGRMMINGNVPVKAPYEGLAGEWNLFAGGLMSRPMTVCLAVSDSSGGSKWTCVSGGD